MAATTSSDAVKQIHYLAACLKAPRITEAASRLADQARDASWTFEDYSPRSSNAKSPPATPPGRSYGSAPPGSRRPKPWKTSTSTLNPPSGNRLRR